MFSVLLLAAMNTAGPVDCLPPPGTEVMFSLTIPPFLHSSDEFPGEVPFPGVPRPGVEKQTTFPSRAILIIRLPPDADLYINKCFILSGSNRRTFVTPELLPEHAFYYDLKVRVVREFRPYVQFQRVIFRPGEVVVVSFGDLGNGLPFETGWR